MAREAAPPLFALITAHWGARCAHVVAEAGIADLIGDRPETAEMLAARAGVDAEALYRILRLLVSFGVFTATPEGFAHSEQSRLLRSDHPRSLRPYARMIGSDWQWRSFGALDHALRTGETGMSHVFGMESFDYLSRHAALSAVFNQAMASVSTIDLPGVLAAGNFARFPVIADIGGGNGALLLAVLETAPESRGILFDLPDVIEAAAPRGNPRVEAIGGSFFSDPLPRADAYLLRRVIHDWRDEEAHAILSAIRSAAEPGAALILLETPLPEGPEPHRAKGLDITMLTVVGGKERTVGQYRSLMDSTGFDFVGTTETPTGLCLLEGRAR